MGQTVELESYLQDARSSLHISGYAVLNDWLSLQELHELREEAGILLEDSETGLAGNIGSSRGCILQTVEVPASTASCQATFQIARSSWPCQKTSCRILFGQRMACLVQACLGCPGFLFNEQYIIKPPQSTRSAFAWHRDSDWLGAERESSYISL